MSARKGPALAVLLLGSLISLGVFLTVETRARTTWQREFDRDAGDIAAALVNGLDIPLEALESLPGLYASSDDVTRDEFRAFVAPMLARHPAIYAFEWLPEVPEAERGKWESRAREEGITGFRFTEVGADFGMVAAKPRPLHVPIFYMEPREPKALGFDITSDTVRLEPFARAKQSGRAVTSGRIRLVEDAPGVHSVAVFLPVKRKREFFGCGVEVFRLKPVVERALRGYDLVNYGLGLFDQESVPESERLLYEKPGPNEAKLSHFEKSFPFADRTWTVHVTTTPPARAANLWVLLGGLLTSMLAGLVVHTTVTISSLRRRVQDAERLGQYTLVSKIGEGGMGVVYQASHAMLRRPTALKLLPATEDGTDDDERHRRFEREVQLTSQLTHPNTIAVYDYGRTPSGVLYYVMEYIDGIDFEQLVRQEGPLPPGRVVFLLKQVLGALAEAHGIGLIHRDVKPGNLMVCERGGIPDFVKVLDFGLAKQLRASGPLDVSRADALIGTPHYLAPESILGRDIGPAADIYAVGAVAYYLLTGHTVFHGASIVEIGVHHLKTTPEPPSRRLGRPIPEGLEALVLDCLEKDPFKRPASAHALLGSLDALHDVPLWTRREAAQWWASKGSELCRKRHAEAKSAEHATVEVDVERRSVTGTDATVRAELQALPRYVATLDGKRTTPNQ